MASPPGIQPRKARESFVVHVPTQQGDSGKDAEDRGPEDQTTDDGDDGDREH
jgi:hypothetical protein